MSSGERWAEFFGGNFFFQEIYSWKDRVPRWTKRMVLQSKFSQVCLRKHDQQVLVLWSCSFIVCFFQENRSLSWNEASSYASGAANAEFLDLYRCRWKAEASCSCWKPSTRGWYRRKTCPDILPVQRQGWTKKTPCRRGQQVQSGWLLRFWSAQLLKAYWNCFPWTILSQFSICPVFPHERCWSAICCDRWSIGDCHPNG